MSARSGWIGRTAPCEHCGATIVYEADAPEPPPPAPVPSKPSRRRRGNQTSQVDSDGLVAPADEEEHGKFWLARIGPELAALVGIVALCAIFAFLAAMNREKPVPKIRGSVPAEGNGGGDRDAVVENDAAPSRDEVGSEKDKLVWLPEMTPATVGPLEIMVTNLEFGHASLVDKDGASFRTETARLIATVKVRNVSDLPVKYAGWMGLDTPSHVVDNSRAFDGGWNEYNVRRIHPPQRLAGYAHAATIQPGEIHEDAIVFDTPKAGYRTYRLELAAPIVGVDEYARFSVKWFQQRREPRNIYEKPKGDRSTNRGYVPDKRLDPPPVTKKDERRPAGQLFDPGTGKTLQPPAPSPRRDRSLPPNARPPSLSDGDIEVGPGDAPPPYQADVHHALDLVYQEAIDNERDSAKKLTQQKRRNSRDVSDLLKAERRLVAARKTLNGFLDSPYIRAQQLTGREDVVPGLRALNEPIDKVTLVKRISDDRALVKVSFHGVKLKGFKPGKSGTAEVVLAIAVRGAKKKAELYPEVKIAPTPRINSVWWTRDPVMDEIIDNENYPGYRRLSNDELMAATAVWSGFHPNLRFEESELKDPNIHKPVLGTRSRSSQKKVTRPAEKKRESDEDQQETPKQKVAREARERQMASKMLTSIQGLISRGKEAAALKQLDRLLSLYPNTNAAARARLLRSDLEKKDN